MTTKITPELQTARKAVPLRPENQPLDERVWRAWKEKNEIRDKVKLARRIKVITILVVLSTLAVLAQRLS